MSPIREKPSHSGQLDEPLFHSDTHVSFPKANGTHHETFHSSPGAANSLPDVKKCTVLRRYSCHCHPSPLAQLSTTLKTKGDPRERQQKKPLFIDSAISFVQSIFLLLSRFISYAPMMYGRASMFTSLFR